VSQLVCVFTIKENLDYITNIIESTYLVLFKKIFILGIQDSEEFVCSFNIDKEMQRKQLPNAMLVHRKRDTNTIYTINSLNALIKQQNQGVLDKAFKIEWTNYSNGILLLSSNELKFLNTYLYQIINVK
jgi:hypothetical protein